MVEAALDIKSLSKLNGLAVTALDKPGMKAR